MMGVDIPRIETTHTPIYDACFLGRLHPSKGILDLINIWRKVCDSRPGSRLAVIGTGPLEEKLKTDVHEMSMDGLVEITGYLPRDELNQVMFSSTVFVFPSHEEGFGISLLEGMAFGLPVIAYALPHYEEVFGDVPVLAPIGEIDGFAARVLELLEDEKLRERKSGESRELALHHTWKHAMRREASAIVRAVRVCGSRFKG